MEGPLRSDLRWKGVRQVAHFGENVRRGYESFEGLGDIHKEFKV
jgi:hypothetical protein